MRYLKELVSLRESSSGTLLSERRESLKSQGLHVNRTTSPPLSTFGRRIGEADSHNLGSSRNNDNIIYLDDGAT